MQAEQRFIEQSEILNQVLCAEKLRDVLQDILAAYQLQIRRPLRSVLITIMQAITRAVALPQAQTWRVVRPISSTAQAEQLESMVALGPQSMEAHQRHLCFFHLIAC